MVTLSNVAAYRAIKSGELTYSLPDGSIGEFVETGSLGLSMGSVFDEKYSPDLVKELWEEGSGYPLDPFESVFVESEELVGTRSVELEPSLNSSLARMGITLHGIVHIEPRTKPRKVRALLQNGPIGVYITKGLPYMKLRPHKTDEERYMSTEEVLEAAKKGAIKLWPEKQIDFRRYRKLEELIEAYKNGDPWKPESPLEFTHYFKRGSLNLPLNTQGALKVGKPPYIKYGYVVLDSNSKPFRQGHQDFMLQSSNSKGRLKILKGEHYLVNTSVVLNLDGVVGEILEQSPEITELVMHSTSKFLDSGNTNAPVCELHSHKTVFVSPKNTVSLKFEKIYGVTAEFEKIGGMTVTRDSKFSFQRFPRLPRWYDDSDLMYLLLVERRGIRGHSEEKKIYKWIHEQLGLRFKQNGLTPEEWTSYQIAERMNHDLPPKKPSDAMEKKWFLEGLVQNKV